MTLTIPHVYGADAGANGRTMPTHAPRKPRMPAQTWRDWRPHEVINDDQLLTRAEFLEALGRRGLNVAPTTLANWEYRNLTPRGIRERRGRSTVVLYPPWAIELVLELEAMKRAGVTLREIGPTLRMQFSARAERTIPQSAAFAAANKKSIPQGTATSVTSEKSVPQSAAIAVLPSDLAERLTAFVRDHEVTFGATIARAEVRLTDTYGNVATFSMHTPPRPD